MFGRNKFKKLKREDVVDAIIELSKQQEDLETGVLAKSDEVEKLLERGRKEKNRDIKLLCAKKVTSLRDEIKRDSKRAAFLLYNIKMLEKLKAAIDDNQFVKNTTKLPLNQLLSDQKALAQFLESDDELLAMFEMQEQFDSESNVDSDIASADAARRADISE